MLVRKVRLFFLVLKSLVWKLKKTASRKVKAARVWLNLQANGKQHKNVNTVLFKYLHGLKGKKNESLHFKFHFSSASLLKK